MPLIPFLVFVASGAAALGHQAVWTRMLSAGLGSEAPAVIAVITAVMAGLGTGAWILDRSVSRSARPGLWCAGLEVFMGVWGAGLALGLPFLSHLGSGWMGLDPSPWRQGVIAFGVPLVVLLPITAAMGGTFPAMERLVAQAGGEGRWVGAVYGANTLGAALGLLTSISLLMPVLGLRSAALVLAALNLVCGAGVWIWQIRLGSRRLEEPRSTSGQWNNAAWMLMATAAATGVLGVGFEVLGIRALSQVLENTIYTYALVVAMYLFGTAIGAALYQRWGGAGEDNDRLLSRLLAAQASAVAVGILALQLAPHTAALCVELFGTGRTATLGLEAVVAGTVFLAPTILMGALFSCLAQRLRGPAGGVGRAAGVNALGGAIASVAFGMVLLPVAGMRLSLVLLGVCYALLGFCHACRAARLSPRHQPCEWYWGTAGLAVVVLSGFGCSLRLVDLAPREVVRVVREGALGIVAVTEEPGGHRALRVDNRFQMGGTAAVDALRRQAHLPLLLHPRPRRALFLGTGTGITLGATTLYAGLKVDGVELLPEVMRVMGEFEPANRLTELRRSGRMIVADARRFVKNSNATYDVIVADLFHPARDGAGFLYTTEHFAGVRQRLAPGGLFCQWLPLHQLDEVSLRLIARTFRAVFPEGELWWLRLAVEAPVLGLIGFTEVTELGPGWLEARVEAGPLRDELRELGWTDSIRLLGLRIGGADRLAMLAGSGRMATDDWPGVVFLAPALRYIDHSKPYDRMPLVMQTRPSNVEAAGLPDGDAWSIRLTRCHAARDVFLSGLMAESEGRDSEALSAWVESARLSEDFTAGYARCLSRVSLILQSDPGAARELLERLAAAQPLIPVARQMLERIPPVESDGP